jgi:DNA-binding response OmpR family regulator
MSGYDAARAIRRHDASAAWLPIIALTANAMATDRQQCMDAGMDDYITKPVNIGTLAKVLDKWLLRSREADAGQCVAGCPFPPPPEADKASELPEIITCVKTT